MTKTESIVRYSLDQIRDLIAKGADMTDHDAIKRKTDADVEADVAADPDADIGETAQTWVRVPDGYDVKLVKRRALSSDAPTLRKAE